MRVLDSTALPELHGILQVAIGWEGFRLSAFEISAVQYGVFELHVVSRDVAFRDFGFCERDRFPYVDAGIVCCESPVDGSFVGVAVCLPGGGFADPGVAVGNAAGESCRLGRRERIRQC